MKNETWVYETKCRRCGKLNGWLFNPYGDIPTEEEINFHRIIHDGNPFRIVFCEHCEMQTRQEWVAIYKKGEENARD